MGHKCQKYKSMIMYIVPRIGTLRQNFVISVQENWGFLFVLNHYVDDEVWAK